MTERRHMLSLVLGAVSAVEAYRETEHLAELSQSLGKVISLIAKVVGSITAVGAIYGALNTLYLYSAVSGRAFEIATLRAIGLGGLPIVASELTEALSLSLLGGDIGAASAWPFFNGRGVNSLGGNFTQLVFRLAVTPDLIVQGIARALGIGLIGGLLPALRAVRLPIAAALQTP